MKLRELGQDVVSGRYGEGNSYGLLNQNYHETRERESKTLVFTIADFDGTDREEREQQYYYQGS